MGTDAVLSGASQRADAHHRRFSRSSRLASLILSPSLPFAVLTTISSSPSSNSRVARRTISLTLSVARIRVWLLYLPAESAIPCSVVSVFAASCTRPCIAFILFSFLIIHLSVFLFFSISFLFFSVSYFCSSFQLRFLGIYSHR